MHIRATEEDEIRGLDHKYLSDVEWDDQFTNGWTTPYRGDPESGILQGSGVSMERPAEPVVPAVEPKREAAGEERKVD